MKIKDLKSKSANELNTLREEARASIKKFHFAISGSKQKNVRQGRNLRRGIARIETLLKQNNGEK